MSIFFSSRASHENIAIRTREGITAIGLQFLPLTVLMFSIVFVAVRPLAPGALFAGFIAAQLVTFAGFLLRDKHEVMVGNNKNGE